VVRGRGPTDTVAAVNFEIYIIPNTDDICLFLYIINTLWFHITAMRKLSLAKVRTIGEGLLGIADFPERLAVSMAVANWGTDWRFPFAFAMLSRVEMKTPFFISAKSENSLTFRESLREIVCFREIFRENFRFRKSFCAKFWSCMGWFLQNVSVFAKILNQCFGSQYTFRWLLNPDPHPKWKIFAKNILVLRWFLQKVSVFAKIFNQCFRSQYTFRWLLNPDPHSK
jgi:hypothetical protein